MSIDAVLNERAALIGEKKSIEARLAKLDAQIVKFMGDRATVSRPDWVITYAQIDRPAYEVRATSYMKLTIKERVKERIAA